MDLEIMTGDGEPASPWMPGGPVGFMRMVEADGDLAGVEVDDEDGAPVEPEAGRSKPPAVWREGELVRKTLLVETLQLRSRGKGEDANSAFAVDERETLGPVVEGGPEGAGGYPRLEEPAPRLHVPQDQIVRAVGLVRRRDVGTPWAQQHITYCPSLAGELGDGELAFHVLVDADSSVREGHGEAREELIGIHVGSVPGIPAVRLLEVDARKRADELTLHPARRFRRHRLTQGGQAARS